MIRTVKAEVDTDGCARLLEPLRVTKPSRALVTSLDTELVSVSQTGNAAEAPTSLQEHRLSDEPQPSAEGIEAHILRECELWS